ncbi:hypothetical protein M408DRAFT_326474 [Serendipita vermifera MAFF 305830]|uniref:DUF6533 domain-containing protein n=1 Tax=Serendipita vermifera MAFF 305830 TaxID=933852 RepID=A0A0C2X3E5_SERVB|nr:hypothetical protein M408DRAFT_326474 [Serendipita vermifera MAFF 305830]
MEDVLKLIHAIDGLRQARYMNAAATTFYLYDILITLDQEAEHIWARLSFNLPTILYITNRYICLAFFLISTYDLAGFHGPFSDDECQKPKDIVGMMLAHISWTGVMTIRTCALWRQKKWLVRLIWAIWPCVLGAIITVGCLSRLEISRTISYNTLVGICASSETPRIFAVAPIPPALYEMLLTTLTILKAMDFNLFLPGSAIPMLYRVLARDGVAYFVVSALISMGNMITWLALPASQMYLFLYVYWAFSSVIVSRMVLNLRATYSRSQREQSGCSSVSANVGTGTKGSSRAWEHGTRFIHGEGYLGIDTMDRPKPAPIEEEPWNVQVFNVPSTSSLPLQDLDAAGRKSLVPSEGHVAP